MKRLLSLFCLLSLLFIGIDAQTTIRVQGFPRQVSAAQAQKLKKAAKAAATLDASKVKYFVGEGDSTSYLIIQWADSKGAEKLVWGYRYNGDKETGETMLKAIAKADPRFYMMIQGGTQYGSAIGGLGFDLNGNQVIGMSNPDVKEEPELKDGCFDIGNGYGFDGWSPKDSTDHWRSGWYSGYWSYWVADQPTDNMHYSGVGASGRQLRNGTVDYWNWSSLSGEEFPDANYYFYIDEPKTGVQIPGEITLPLSDNGMLPVVLGATGQNVSFMTWTVKNVAGGGNTKIINSIKSDAKNFNGAVTFGGDSTGIVKATVKARIGSSYFYSDTCYVTVTAPEKPITALAFANAEMTAGLRKTVTNPLTLTPADATYTGVSYSSSDEEVASVNSKGEIKTSHTGECVITATSKFDKSVKASFKLTVICEKPVTAINTDDSIVMTERDIYEPKVEVLPADADYTEVNYNIADPTIVSFYQANLVAHKAGKTTMTITALDGQGASKTVNITVKEQDRTPYDGYQDGTFILNEAWFGHENADMNFLTADNQLMYRVYERENPYEAFGATASSATIYGGKMYVMSKQAVDKGDLTTKGGGRLVVLDAKTLKKIAGFETIGGGDGRSVVGVNPDKVYLGTTGGVVVFDAKNLTVGNVIDGTQGASLYSGQTGDMVKAGKYVFATQQGVGTHVINTETDKIEKDLEDTDIQGVVQSADGNVWLASSTTLTCIDPATLDTIQTVTLPSNAKVGASWSAWRPTSLCSSRTENVLYWNPTAGWSSSRDFYRWEIGTDINDIKPFFTLTGRQGTAADKTQSPYGTVRYDDRTGNLIVMSTQDGWGINYEHNWIYLVDGKTGEVKQTIEPKRYYWFQELPVFPDKYAPEFDGVDSKVELDKADAAKTIDLTGKVTDKDNLAYNISTSLTTPADETVARVELKDNLVTITPVAAGTTAFTLTAESNGVLTEQNIEVKVTDIAAGLDNATASRDIFARDGQLVINGYEGWQFALYNVSGQLVRKFMATTSAFTLNGTAPATYILKGWRNGEAVSVKVAL